MPLQHRPAARLTPVLLLLVLLGCSEEKRDPFDPAVIERDLEERSVGALYKEAEQHPWSAPADQLLTDPHLADFARVAALAEKITEVAGERLDAEMEIAMGQGDDLTRMASAFSALGSARSAATAHLRAALLLGMNPNQHLWVTDRILAAGWIVDSMRQYDRKVAEAEAARDSETSPVLREQRESELRQARDARDAWRQNQGDVQLANARRIDEHADELARFIPSLRRK